MIIGRVIIAVCRAISVGVVVVAAAGVVRGTDRI